MPLRKTPLITGQIYHIFNRSIDRRPIFTHKRNVQRAINTLSFYRFENVPVRLSYYLAWPEERRIRSMQELENENKTIVSVICFCFMPNHFHLLLKQEKAAGISKFLSQFQNSFTKYFNTRRKRKGHIFLGQFKAVRIETEEQLLHTSRYIHLNPYTSFVVKNFEDLLLYQWSSLLEYIGRNKGFSKSDIILSGFKRPKDYYKFLSDYADYQKELEAIKHLILEESS